MFCFDALFSFFCEGDGFVGSFCVLCAAGVLCQREICIQLGRENGNGMEWMGGIRERNES